MLAALGCNLAWGLVDAVMYIIRTATERARLRVLGTRIRGADAAGAQQMIAGAMPDHPAAIVGADELEGMRRRLSRCPPTTARSCGGATSPAAGIFGDGGGRDISCRAAFRVRAGDGEGAPLLSQGITLVMLFLAGMALGPLCGATRRCGANGRGHGGLRCRKC